MVLLCSPVRARVSVRVRRADSRGQWRVLNDVLNTQSESLQMISILSSSVIDSMSECVQLQRSRARVSAGRRVAFSRTSPSDPALAVGL